MTQCSDNAEAAPKGGSGCAGSSCALREDMSQLIAQMREQNKLLGLIVAHTADLLDSQSDEDESHIPTEL